MSDHKQIVDDAMELTGVLSEALNAHLGKRPLLGSSITTGVGCFLSTVLVRVIEGAEAPQEECIEAMDELLAQVRREVLKRIGARP